MSIEPTSEQLQVMAEKARYYSDAHLAEMLGVCTALVPFYREHYRILKGKKVYVKPPDTDLDDLVVEMKSLIRLCEMTNNVIIRQTAKERLRILSEIPMENEWSLEALITANGQKA